MHSTRERIVDRLDDLPEPNLREVLSFVEFLTWRAGEQGEPLLTVAGVLSGNMLSAEEIEAELYGNRAGRCRWTMNDSRRWGGAGVSEENSSAFQQVIENVEMLPLDEQVLLIEIIRRRVIEQRRADLVSEVAEARQAYEAGDVHRGTVDDLMRELGS